ncbi:phosphoserine phosphatase SerB [Pseudoalteromonas denitrificans]|uniref:Phosphoserine phosphatase n=1 Tax=Pseudoalteromonas denitrificans DSM 6059 TaxID=1123010 RepID=A0A1I1LRD3_9GAMM|nr:phosphoserine phosphatase SerB [Pseudoalteromonas denitrificans]SFC75684.1 phosphoserine phosphatase [Pseudoalteromonas denitrificans DSM 6059]
MPSINLSQIQDKKLSEILTLGQWSMLSVTNLVITESSKIKHSEENYLLAFGCELTTNHLKQLGFFLQEEKIESVSICYYQPHEKLKPALVISCRCNIKSIKAKLNDLSEKLACQLSIFSNPPKLNQPGLLVMDMDSTAITIECIDEIARLANVYDEVASVTAQAMSGTLEFSESLKLRVAKLAGIDLSLIEQLKQDLPLMPGVSSLCELLKEKGWKLAIASGGFIPFAQRVQALLNLDLIHANALEVSDNTLTGNVVGVIVDAQEKANFLNKTAKAFDIDIEQTLAMGDGANDLKMMGNAGLGIAVHGKPKVAKTADVAINYGSLLQVAYFIDIPKF